MDIKRTRRSTGLAIEQLREELDIGGVTVVANGAMGSVKNLEILSDMGHDWVVAAKIRGLAMDIFKITGPG